MANFKLIAKLPRFLRRVEGIQAALFNNDGVELDRFNINRRKFQFKLDQDETFMEKKKDKFTIQLTDQNGDATNGFGRNGLEYDLEDEQQSFKLTLKRNKRRSRKNLNSRFTLLDTEAPVFTSESSVSVEDGIKQGARIYDAESSDQSKVRYTLSGRDANLFSINEQSGEVSLNQVADFDSTFVYNFDVTAVDARGNASTQSVVVNVKDTKAPVFTSDSSITIDDTVEKGSVVYDVKATDKSELRFELAGRDSNAFSIKEKSGELIIQQTPELSNKTEYAINVTATDAQGNASSQAVMINVNDTKAPVFTSSGNSSVDENVSSGFSVYQAATTDASSVQYSLTGDDASVFSIDQATGEVVINQSPDYEVKNKYNFIVSAKDSNENTSQQDVTININDVEEGKTVNLTKERDVILSLSEANDTIYADYGELGNNFFDTITDLSSDDNDLLIVKTNAEYDAFDTFDYDDIRINNIEHIRVLADQDDWSKIDLEGVQTNLKSFELNGTFDLKGKLEVSYFAESKPELLDFTGVKIDGGDNGVIIENKESGNKNSTHSFEIRGSSGPDKFEGLLGDVTMRGMDGKDLLTGSRGGVSVIEGGEGLDQINLWTHDAQHTVLLHGQTRGSSKDTILENSFQGFNNGRAKALNTYDLIEIDSATFNNYSAGEVVKDATVQSVSESTDLKGTVVTAEKEEDLRKQNFNANGDGLLGFAADTGTLIYSSTGNFAADAEALLEIGKVEGDNFLASMQINVI